MLIKDHEPDYFMQGQSILTNKKDIAEHIKLGMTQRDLTKKLSQPRLRPGFNVNLYKQELKEKKGMSPYHERTSSRVRTLNRLMLD